MNSKIKQTVLLGVTGCIAAYKSCEILRKLQQADARVKVVMTQNATRFVGPATFKALTREPVATALFDAPGDPIHHISLAKEADVFLIAPATANVISKLAHGTADDLLTTTALATQAPLVIAPAMNEAMWRAQVTQDNIESLRLRGAVIIGPEDGYLACGDEGSGRLAALDTIVDQTLEILKKGSDLAGKRILITAGPTYEPLDPVRFIGNRSSGKTGYAFAAAAKARGAQVTIVSGPVALPNPIGVKVCRVQTAQEMLSCCESFMPNTDIAIFSAAVADYRPSFVASEKIKKQAEDGYLLELVKNPDILATLAMDKKNTFVIGFAAETQNLLTNAREKLVRKQANLIIANDVSSHLGFGTDTNKVWLISPDGEEELPELNKRAIANLVLDRALAALSKNGS